MLWLRAMMLGIGALTLVGYTSSVDAQRYQFTSARYLLPVYLTVPLLFGCLWSLSQPFAVALAARLRGRGPVSRGWLAKSVRGRRSVLATAALAGLLALSASGGAITFAHATTSGHFALPVPPEDTRLEAFLSAHHISAFYADYWTCYRLAFESRERLSCAVRGQDGDPGLELINNRYDPYVRALAATPHPAFLLPAGTAEDRGFVAEASALHVSSAGYVRTTLGGYAIFYYVA
jgi:hypothetical protein